MPYSQLGADAWCLLQSELKRDGSFVDVGAGDGITLSNSYLLEKEFGWNGVCVEANDGLVKLLRENRQCHVVEACIYSSSNREIIFHDPIGDKMFGGIHQHVGVHNTAGVKRKKTTRTLAEVLTELDFPTDIDYLSLDTEGSEYEILKVLPFDKYRFRLITVEHNYERQKRENLRRLLHKNGYRRQARVAFDDWYVYTGAGRL